MKKGAEVACPLQTGHFCFLKRVLGVKRTSCNWSVLRERSGASPVLLVSGCSAVYSIIGCNSELLKKVWHADKGMCAMPGATSCWTAEFMAAFEGLQGRDQYRNAVRSGSAVNAKEFAVDLRARLYKVWEELNDTEPRECRLKRATYHRWFASPLLAAIEK